MRVVGLRDTAMEDAHAHILSLGEASDSQRTSFFAVYDGHGGSTVARYAGDTVHSRLSANEPFKRKDFEAALKRAFLDTDVDLRANPDFRGDPSGCTAVATVITDNLRIICANAGDSRAVLSLGGEAKPLSFDHKPTNKSETSRIVAAGGFVEFGRVNGNLALSRALGDFEFKQSTHLDPEHQIVTADPDITVHEHDENDEFIVIACDGIWDVLSSQQVIDYVRLSISEGKPLQTITEDLMDRCLAPDSDWGGVGCDNMTAMIVAIKGDRTMDEWYEWIKGRVESGKPYETPKDLIDPFSQSNGPRGPMGAAGRAGSGGITGFVGGRTGEDDDGEEEDEIHLPTIQAALKARMAELERQHQDEQEQDQEQEDQEMQDEQAEPPKTSHSAPETL
ncbi:Protein phosphatase 2C 2 [Microbotryomycetes sp. JL221]|nr:Protein phosphatase 2C 2 [Microbotryomycetes sp. JL221]